MTLAWLQILSKLKHASNQTQSNPVNLTEILTTRILKTEILIWRKTLFSKDTTKRMLQWSMLHATKSHMREQHCSILLTVRGIQSIQFLLHVVFFFFFLIYGRRSIDRFHRSRVFGRWWKTPDSLVKPGNGWKEGRNKDFTATLSTN